MNWVTAIFTILPGLISLAEKLFGNGTGAMKKSMVMGAAEAVSTTMVSVSTGGQKETWEKVAPMISQAVDLAVDVANATGWASIENDTAQKWGM